jgi:hypothetical protein
MATAEPTRCQPANQPANRAGHPWEQQPGEPPRWHARFTAYRLLGVRRTIEDAWRQEAKGGKGKRPTHHWYAAAARWGWKARAAAWDVQHLTDAAARQAEHRREAVDAALGILWAKLPDLEAMTFTPRTWAEALKIVVTLQRIEYGQVPPQKVELTGKDGGPVSSGHELDLSKLTDEQVAQLAAILDSLQGDG